MSELILYSGISLLCMVLFYLCYRLQGRVAEKQWLLKQINQTHGTKQQSYVGALSQLKSNSSSLIVTFWIGLMIIPATFVIDYLWFHDIPIEQRVSGVETQNTNQQAPDLNTAIKQLEQKLAENPNDLEGQILYGRSMMSMQKFTQAVGAYRIANQLEPNDANILTELAEAIAFENNTGSFLGEPEQYLSQAIAIEPNHQKAMWLQGIVYFENLQYEAAEIIWTDLLAQVESPNIKTTIVNQINQAREAQNKPVINVSDSSQPSDLIATAANDYLVVIDASEDIKAIKLQPEARLFVYAKQVDGPPMPIAAASLTQPFIWPMSVRIGDSNSLSSERKLSSFDQLQLSAKLSLSGVATPAIDDIKTKPQIVNKQVKNITLILK